MKINILPLIASYLFIIIGSAFFGGCKENKNPNLDIANHCQKDTIFNNDITYLPDIYIGDKYIYNLSVELLKADQLTDRNSYELWFDQVNAIINSHSRLKGLSCSRISVLLEKMGQSIRKYGQGCNASFSELTWLKYGWNLYSSLLKDSDHTITLKGKQIQELLSQENIEWLELWVYLSKVIQYEIDDTTGSSAAYDTPSTFSKIIEFRKELLKKDYCLFLYPAFGNEDAQDLNKTLNSLKYKINGLNAVRYNFDSQNYQIDEDIVKYKALAISHLDRWVDIRKKIASYAFNKNEYDDNTSNLLSFIHAIIHGIRYPESFQYSRPYPYPIFKPEYIRPLKEFPDF